jgi:hypothetical protein
MTAPLVTLPLHEALLDARRRGDVAYREDAGGSNAAAAGR